MARKKSKKSKKLLYLDTSIFYSRNFSHSLQRKNIDSVIGSERCISSKYVFTEIKNHIRAFIEFYILLHNEASVPDALALASSTYRGRFSQKALDLIGKMLGALADKKRALAKLSTVIRMYLDRSHLLVERIIDEGLHCPLSEAKFPDDPGLTVYERYQTFLAQMQCKIEDLPRCDQDSFRAGNSTVIDLIRTDERLCSDGAKRTSAFLGTLAPYGPKKHARGLRDRCSKIGDMIIAIQSPPEATIVSTDKAFEDYGRILNRPYEILPSISELIKRRDEIPTS